MFVYEDDFSNEVDTSLTDVMDDEVGEEDDGEGLDMESDEEDEE